MKKNIPRKEWYKILQKVPSLAVDGALIEKNKILLVQRAHMPYRGLWGLPGGFVEFGERVKDAVVREFFEETGLKAEPVKMVGVYDDPKRDPRGHVISIAFLMRKKSGKIRVSEESLDVRFFSLTRLPRMGGDMKAIVKDAYKLSKKER